MDDGICYKLGNQFEKCLQTPPSSVYTGVFNGSRDLKFSLSLPFVPYVVYNWESPAQFLESNQASGGLKGHCE